MPVLSLPFAALNGFGYALELELKSVRSQGYYGPRNVCAGKFWTVVDAVKKYAKAVRKTQISMLRADYLLDSIDFRRLIGVTRVVALKVTSDVGIPNVLSEDLSGIPEAVRSCAMADTCVLAVGSDLSWAAEGHDARNISYTAVSSEARHSSRCSFV